MIHFRPYQARLVADTKAAFEAGHRNVMAVLPTGGGKCLGKGTPILMFDGTIRPVEEVRVGDLLMGPNSMPRRVLSTCAGSEMLYRVTPTKGDAYVVNESHILSLRRTCETAEPKYDCQRRGGEIVNVSVRDYLTKSKWWKYIHKGWRSGVDFQSTEPLPLDPYFLGAWLGDGNSNGSGITISEEEIAAELDRYLQSIGMKMGFNAMAGEAVTVTFKSSGRKYGRGGSPVGNAFRAMGLINNKHVPHRYKVSDATARLRLLAGIIDTDGYLHHGGYDIVLKNEQLMDDVIFVARSLGFAAYKKSCKKICTNNGVVGDYFRCVVSGDVGRIPCLVPRKIAAPRLQKKSVLVTGITLEQIGVGAYYGFEIDGDRLFMLGDFTVTHNTVVFSGMLSEQDYIAQLVAGTGAASTVAIAHRQELVGQMSVALARCGVRHRVVAPKPIIRRIVKMHMKELGANFVDPRAHCVCAGVDTLIARPLEVEQWAHRIALWVIDEAHHVLLENKWGKAAAMFPNARGLGVTATPTSADGKGLGRHAHGVFDALVAGPTMRELIDDGWLTDYRIIAPKSDIDLSSVTTGADGDFSKAKLKAAVRRSHIVGDVVEHYLKWAPGKLGVTFATDVETAADIAAKFNKAGVRAEVVSAKTPDNLRAEIVERFRRGDLQMLVNVDLFGEGFDLPAIEVVIMARPTESFALYAQQWGRGLRLMLDGRVPETREGRLAAIAASRKPRAIIIDHVGNVERFRGPPDAVHNQQWSLDGRDRKTRGQADDVIPLRSCLNVECLQVYERFHPACPYCGHKVEPTARNAPEFVDGDLTELDAETMARLRGEVAKVDQSPADYRAQLQRQRCPIAGQHANVKAHVRRQEAQEVLRTAMEWWAAHHRDAGRSDAEAYRRFYHSFGVDVLSAMSLDTESALKLAGAVSEEIGR